MRRGRTSSAALLPDQRLLSVRLKKQVQQYALSHAWIANAPFTLLTAYSESRICRIARVPAHGAFGRFESGYYLPTGMVAFLVQW